MKLEVLRFSSGKDSTSGILLDASNGKKTFLCYTLEDEQRDVKVYGETRIPAGTYKLKLREEGGFHNKHLARYGPDWHKGMIWVQEVPNFKWILWHSGNTDENSAGCLLLGNSQTSNLVKKDGFIGGSRDAYKLVYPRVSEAILSGQDVEVTYIDYDGDIQLSNKTSPDMIQPDSIMDKLQEISGELQVVSAKLDGRKID
jgi:hypothetical protein|tara:strand:- start:650 stop:1249 length:600 start_codon:yes stop_codon:yes gene_type:complete